MAGLKPMFTMQAVEQYMQNSIDAYEQKVIEALQYQGELFVNKARALQTYVDDTGNLRSSIGYVILKDGEVVDRSFKRSSDGYGDGADGITAAWNTVDEVAKNYPNGFILIGVAGMNYAAAVESKGYDVITGSAPEDKDIKDLLGAITI